MKKFAYCLMVLVLAPTLLCQAQQKDEIEKILILYKTHLDIGFTDLANNVVDTYNHHFIPAALKLSEELAKDSVSGMKYPWTTGSWLLWNYLERGYEEENKRIEEAIRRGDFWWHALPFTQQVELCDSALFATDFRLSEQLDERFGRKTLAAKITDVPGLTRATIPFFKRHGVKLLHLGSNPGAAVPRVPEVFRWKDEASGEAMNVIYQSDYGKPLRIPGTKTLVMVEFTNDNHGPHPRQRVEKIYERIRKEYPNAKVVPSSLNEVALAVEEIEDQLPVVTSEWGDTWVYGTASDPKKVAEFRQLLRLRNQWMAEGKLVAGSEVDMRFIVPLLLLSEHTWGVDIKSYLYHWDRYELNKFPEFLNSEEARFSEKSWREQRNYVWQAVGALPANLQREAIASLTELTPERPVPGKGKPCMGKVIDTKYFRCGFNTENGSMNFLMDKRNKMQWADEEHTMGELAFQIYSGDDFNNFIKQYCPEKPAGWMVADYGKPGLDKLNLKNTIVNYRVKEMTTEKTGEGTRVCIALAIEAEGALYGAPREAYVTYLFPDAKAEIKVEVDWFNKSKNRIPEAVWFSFRPTLTQGKAYVEKLGSKIDVQDVIYNGARQIHGVGKYASIENGEHTFRVSPMDANLVQFNQRHIMNFNNEVANADKGMNFCLLNTMWGTNYPQWYGDDMKYRFTVTLE